MFTTSTTSALYKLFTYLLTYLLTYLPVVHSFVTNL